MLEMHLNTKYFLQMYLNTKYIDVFKYFLNTFLYYFQNIVLIHSIHYKLATFDRNYDFKIRRDDQKISYERRVYESVDDNSLSKAISQKTDEKNKSCDKGLNY